MGEKRAGYRHGRRAHTLSTSLGATTIAMPRARIAGEDGKRHKGRSQIIPRYQRRTEWVDEAILTVYLSGTHTRPLARGTGAIAARDSAVERRGIASGGEAQRGFCGLGHARSTETRSCRGCVGCLV